MKIIEISINRRPTSNRSIRWAAPEARFARGAARSNHNESLRYLDTICLRYPVQLPDPQANPALGVNVREQTNGYKYYSYVGNGKTAKGATVSIHYLPRAYDRKSYLYLTFSVPKLVIGTNAQIIPAHLDIVQSIRKELLPVFASLNIPPLDILDAVLCRLDISKNFNVGSNKQDYLNHANSQIYPRRSREGHSNYSYVGGKNDGENNGVVFASPSGRIRTSVYDKWKESRQAGSKGVIRLESSFRSPRKVEKLFGDQKQPTMADVSLALVMGVIQRELAILGLDKPIQACSNTAAELVVRIGPTRAYNLKAFIDLEHMYPGLSAKDMAAVTGYSVKTVNKRRKQVKDLGIGVTLPENIILPALTFAGMSTTPGKNGAERHSNTYDHGTAHVPSETAPANEVKKLPRFDGYPWEDLWKASLNGDGIKHGPSMGDVCVPGALLGGKHLPVFSLSACASHNSRFHPTRWPASSHLNTPFPLTIPPEDIIPVARELRQRRYYRPHSMSRPGASPARGSQSPIFRGQPRLRSPGLSIPWLTRSQSRSRFPTLGAIGNEK